MHERVKKKYCCNWKQFAIINKLCNNNAMTLFMSFRSSAIAYGFLALAMSSDTAMPPVLWLMLWRLFASSLARICTQQVVSWKTPVAYQHDTGVWCWDVSGGALVSLASFSPQKKPNAWGGLPFVDVNPIKAYASWYWRHFVGSILAFFFSPLSTLPAVVLLRFPFHFNVYLL